MGVREKFLGLADAKPEVYVIDDCELFIKSWSYLERAKVLAILRDQRDDLNAYAKIVQLSVVDADGAPQFTEKDVPFIAKKDGRRIDKLANECCKRNGILDGYDDPKKSSETIPPSESVSD